MVGCVIASGLAFGILSGCGGAANDATATARHADSASCNSEALRIRHQARQARQSVGANASLLRSLFSAAKQGQDFLPRGSAGTSQSPHARLSVSRSIFDEALSAINRDLDHLAARAIARAC